MWVIYSIVRIGLFVAAFFLLYWLLGDPYWWLAAIAAAVVALCIAYIFLGRLRMKVAADLAARAARRTPKVDLDAAAEDAATDRAE